MQATVTAEALDVLAAAEKLRASDPLIVDPHTLLADTQTLLAALNAIECVVVRRLASIRATDATAEVAGRSPRQWLVEDERVAGRDASRLLRLATELPLHQATKAAYDDGVISGKHAAAVLSALRTLPPALRDTVEPHLLQRASEFPPEEISGFVDELLEGLGIDAESDIRRERRHASRGISLDATLDGNRCLSGLLTPEVAASLKQALAAAAEPISPDDERSCRQRDHDALGVIANHFLAARGPSFTGAPRTVVVTMTLDDLDRRLTDAGVQRCPDSSSAAALRRLACDAGIVPVVLGSHSEVLDIGRIDHEFTAAIRRAAWIRDGGQCAFPRCRNACVELHHVTFRRHGGATSLDNAAWLCAMHHWLVHEGGWTLRRSEDGDYVWTSPHGRERVRHLSTASPPS